MSRVVAIQLVERREPGPHQLFVRERFHVWLDCGHGRTIEVVQGTDPVSMQIPCLECEAIERGEPGP